MDYFNSSDAHCRGTTNISSYVYNLTASYTDQHNEVSIVATSVVMLVLAALLFNLNLLAGVSDAASAIINPTVRLFLSASLSLFLPVMSYLFSEAKGAAGSGQSGSTSRAGGKADLPLRARLILTWMLLVEFLRKKVEAILVATGRQGRQGPADRAGRVAFLGFLIFWNVQNASWKAAFGVLWVVAAAKLAQRIAIAEFVKRSFAFGKNPQLLTAYMAQMLEKERHVRRDEEHPSHVPDGSELLRRCKYAVMGEDNLEAEAGPQGYRVKLKNIDADDDDAVVTVGKIWALAESDQLLASDPRLKRLCVSFALFKLLRRRFEDLPIAAAEARDCRDLIFKGLCNDGAIDREATAAALFQVINDQLNFLTEYYHSVLPVVLASPFFFLVNYLMYPLIVLGLCLMTIVLCAKGDIAFAYLTTLSDNRAISLGVVRMIRCLVSKVLKSPSAFFSIVDLSITFLLVLSFVYEEVWEFFVFLLSNWLMVSLLCDYTAKPRWRNGLRRVIPCILCVRKRMSGRNLRFKQFSVLRSCRLPVMLWTVAVRNELKRSILEYLAAYDHDDGATPLSNGRSALARYPGYHSQLSWACESDSVAEVILTWHIATSLFEVRYPPQKGRAALSNVATTLSKYCAYLVAFLPELLPDDRDGTVRVYMAMETELKEELGWMGYYFLPAPTRYQKLMHIASDVDEHEAGITVVRKGARLGKLLMDEAAGNEVAVWKLLADVWTELVVYLAPSKDAEQVKKHERLLALGGEFITVLWALVMQTGIIRPVITSPAAAGTSLY